MRSILLHVHADHCLEARLQVALDLARSFDAHLTCLQVTSFDFILPGDINAIMATEMVPALRKSANELRDELSARLAREDVAWDWQQEEGFPPDHLLRASSLSDLVVVGAADPATRGRGPSSLAGDLAIRGRTPVLVVPQAARSLDVTGPAMVGWNGSMEAAHALKAATPLLAEASSVLLASVSDGADPDTAFQLSDGAEYLSRHGIECELLELPLEGGSAAQVLARAAAERRAGYLVMGAYGHARFVEAIWGGVTRELLTETPLPLLTTH